MFKGWSKSIKGNLFVIFGLIVLVLLVTNIAFVRFVNRIDIMYSEATDTIVLLSDMSESVSDAESELRDVINEGTINRFNVLVNNLTDIEIKLTDARAGIKDEETYYYMVFLGNMLNSFLDELHYFEDDLLYADTSYIHSLETDFNNISTMANTINLLQLKELEQQKQDIRMQMRGYITIMWAVIVIMTFILLIYGHLGIRRITEPINRLVQNAAKIASMQFNIPDEELDGFSELLILQDSLKDISVNMSNMVESMKEKNRLEAELKDEKIYHLKMQNLYKETRLQFLYAQINPHFLFNTLNVIERQAYFAGNKNIEDIISKLADMLRYSLRNRNNSVEVRQELKNIQDYYDIQKVRFGDNLKYKLEVEEECLDCIMPCFVLQPLMENAILHGLQPYDYKGQIEIQVYREDEFVIIRISDNGIGMDTQNLFIREKVKKRETSIGANKDGHGIGLANVRARLQMFYNRDDCMQIDSEIGEGTKITIRLDKKYGTTEKDINC